MVGLCKVTKVQRIGKVNCLDLRMKSDHHNFVCEGLVTSNSHGASYAVLAYITAWLKTYYPQEYIASLLSCNMDDNDKLRTYIKETKRMKLKLKNPDINASNERFAIKGKYVLYPFTAIKGCGEAVVNNLMEARAEDKFADFVDFYERINKRVINVGVIAKLILSDCFRKWGTIEEIWDEYIDMRGNEKTYRQLYCEDCEFRYPVAIKASETLMCPNCGGMDVTVDPSECQGKLFDKTYANNMVFGFNFVDDPLKQYAFKLSQHEYVPMQHVKEVLDGSCLIFPAYVVRLKKHIDKNSNEMAFLDLSNGEFEASMTVFASDWKGVCDVIEEGNCYLFTGKKNRGDNFLFAGSAKKL